MEGVFTLIGYILALMLFLPIFLILIVVLVIGMAASLIGALIIVFWDFLKLIVSRPYYSIKFLMPFSRLTEEEFDNKKITLSPDVEIKKGKHIFVITDKSAFGQPHLPNHYYYWIKK